MDGPNNNLDVSKQYQFRVEKEHPVIVNIGSCGVHVLHRAMQHGIGMGKYSSDYQILAIIK